MKLLTSLLIALYTLFSLTLATPDRLNDALQSAAKSANAVPKPASSRKPGAQPSPGKPANTGPNYAAQCRAKNGKLATVIETFCGQQKITVPSTYTSKGWCDWGGRDLSKPQIDGSFDGEDLWCVKVGSKKRRCQPTALEKSKWVNKLMEVCAKGGKRGLGKAKDGECFIYQTGMYDGLAANVELNPFRGATKPEGY